MDINTVMEMKKKIEERYDVCDICGKRKYNIDVREDSICLYCKCGSYIILNGKFKIVDRGLDCYGNEHRFSLLERRGY